MNYYLTATQFEHDAPSIYSGVYGALKQGTVVAVTEVREAQETTDAISDVWLRRDNGRWIPMRLEGHEYAHPA